MSDSLSHDIIICVHNGYDDVKECLDSVLAHKSRDYDGEIIIVDDNSNAATSALLQHYNSNFQKIRVIRLDNQHFYTKAANIGLKNSSSRFKTLLNSDTVVTDGWEAGLLKTFSLSPWIGIVGPLSNAASTQSVPFIEGTSGQTAINSLPHGVSIDDFARIIKNLSCNATKPFTPLVHGFCLTISDAVIEKIGYFDEVNFPNGYGEENDYCFRADDAGFVLAISTDVFIYHKKSKSYVDSQRVKYMESGMRALVEKYGVERIERSVQFMKNNPFLKKIRQGVKDYWPGYYNLRAENRL